MKNSFNIHDWQAKQIQLNLTEQDEFQKRQDALTPGKNPDYFYGDGSLDKLRGDIRDDNLEPIKKGKMVHLNEYFEDIGKMKLGDTTIDVGHAKMDLVPKNLNEQGFDDRFKGAMSDAGFSDDEQDDIMSRDVGSPFPGTDYTSPFTAKAKDYIETFRQEYRDMSDEGIDEFSVEIINHLLDNTAAQAAAKIYFGKKGI
jgi:hypothetical protein